MWMHTTRALLVPALAVSLSGAASLAQDEIEAPVTFHRLAEKVLVVKAGDVYPDQVVAIASRKGLVLVDAGISPTLTRSYRRIIEREFGRDDFAYVINTHHHFDHTNGNQVFPEAAIVGHERCPEAMRRFVPEIDRFVASRRERYARRAGWLQDLDPSSGMAGRLRDLVYTSRMMCDDLEDGFVLTPPSVTFLDRLKLDLGDLTLRLFYFGDGFHTDNDVVVHVPELGLVFTGDLLRAYETTAPVTSEGDIERWIEVLDELLEDASAIRHVITIHAGILPPDRLGSMRDALRSIREERKGRESGAAMLEREIARVGVKAAVKNLRALGAGRSGSLYLLEGDLSAIGERLLAEDRADDAVEVFRLVAEKFPRSVDAHDWLGVAHMEAGHKEPAIRSFERSLELFPLNSGAYDLLRMLQEP
jgi:glyoxylase-like metal-dependent hydrolase (beta-lactamase superfamily II)